MTPEVERFVDLATRPLEGRPEQREEAKVELMSRISHQGVPLEMVELGAQIASLEKVQVLKAWPRRVVMLVMFLSLLAATSVMTTIFVREVALGYQAQMMGFGYGHGYGGSGVSEESMLSRWVESAAPGIPLRNGSDSELDRAVRRYPDDVALFQQDLLRSLIATPGGLSAEQRHRAEEIDPGNGYYDFINIQSLLTKAMGGSGGRHSTSTTKVSDEKAFDAALNALSRTASTEEFHDASGELKRRQFDAFPPSQGFLDGLTQASFGEFIRSSVPTSYFYYYGSDSSVMISVQSSRLETASDVEGLLNLRDQVLAVTRLMVADSAFGGVDGERITSWPDDNLTPIRESLLNLGERAEADELDKILTGLRGVGPGSHSLSWPDGSPSNRLNDRDGAPEDLTLAEVVPAGETERAYIQKLVALAAAHLALLVLVFSAFEAIRRPRRIVGMARGLSPLLGWRDRVWIFGLGLLVPWAWFLLITGLTPFGLRDLPLGYRDGFGIVVSLIQASATFIFSAVMVLWTAYWRWEKRGGFLAFRGGAMVIGWISGFLAAASVPAAGMVRYFDLTSDDDMAMFLAGVSGLSATGLLWLIWIGVLNVCTPKSNALRANLVVRTALPIMLAGLASVLMAAFIQCSAEEYWVGQDRLFPSWTSGTHKNALEERTSKEVRDRILTVLGEAP